jgi:hypothetical protein
MLSKLGNGSRKALKKEQLMYAGKPKRNQNFFVTDINGVSGVVSPVSMFTNKSGIA